MAWYPGGMRTVSLTRTISVSTGTILRTIGILGALAVLWMIGDILLSCFVAVLLAGMMYPAAEWAAERKIPKLVTVLLIYFLLFGVIGAVITLLVPAVSDQSKAFFAAYGDQGGIIPHLSESVRAFAQRHGVTVNLTTSLSSFLTGMQAQAQGIFGNIFGTVSNIFVGIAGFILVLVLALYMVIEDQAIGETFRHWVPREYQAFSIRLSQLLMQKLGGWMRGQLLLCLIIGALYLIAFIALGVPYPLLLAGLGGIFEFIPYIGPMLSAVPAVLLAVTVSPTCAILTLIAITIIQQLENNFIVPKVMEKTVGLNPIVSIVAFMIGAKLFGVVGAIFAIPVATAVHLILTEGRAWRKNQHS